MSFLSEKVHTIRNSDIKPKLSHEIKESLESEIKDLSKKHGCSVRKVDAKDGYTSVELAGKDDYSDIGKVVDAVDAVNLKWRSAMGMGYVTFNVNDKKSVKETLTFKQFLLSEAIYKPEESEW